VASPVDGDAAGAVVVWLSLGGTTRGSVLLAISGPAPARAVVASSNKAIRPITCQI